MKVIGGDWVENFDHVRNRKYYANLRTKETRWTFPEEILDKAEVEEIIELAENWVEAIDKKTNKKYYYNKITRETTWKKPVKVLRREIRQSMQSIPTTQSTQSPIAQSTQVSTPEQEEEKEEVVEERLPRGRHTSLLPQTPSTFKSVREVIAEKEAQLRSQQLKREQMSQRASARDTSPTSRSSSASPTPITTNNPPSVFKLPGMEGTSSNKNKFAALREMANTLPTEEEYEDTAEYEYEPTKTGDADMEELVEYIGDATMEQYVEKHFNFDRKGLFNSRTTIEKLVTWKADIIKHSLKILPPELSAEAVQLFKNITGFMGDRANSKSEQEHAVKLLSNGLLSPPELRDELFCQLYKQTNHNPSIDSTIRGWQLILLCLTTLSPSDELRPYIMSHFLQNSAHSNPQIATLAETALFRCHKASLCFPRREIPTIMEMEALRLSRKICIRIWFIDLNYIVVEVDSWTTIRELKDMIVRRLNIKNSIPFALFEVSTTEEERILLNDERVLDVVSIWQHIELESLASETVAYEEFRFMYKLQYYFHIDENDPAAVLLIYHEAVENVIDSSYPCTVDDALTLAALQLQEQFGDFDERKGSIIPQLRRYVPDRCIETVEEDVLQEKIIQRYIQLAGYDRSDCRISYLDYVSRWPCYGCAYYFVEPMNNEELPLEMAIAISNKGIYFVDNVTKEYLEEYTFENIVTWGYSAVQLTLALDVGSKQTKLSFKTRDGKEISDMLHAYMKNLKNSRF